MFYFGNLFEEKQLNILKHYKTFFIHEYKVFKLLLVIRLLKQIN